MSTIIATGRLGQDATLRTLQSGTQVASFSIADDIGYGDKKTTQWLQCALFGKRAESLVPYLTKGTIVEIVGTPVAEGYATRDGKNAATIKVTVNEIKLHGGTKKDDAPVADKGRSTGRQSDDDEISF